MGESFMNAVVVGHDDTLPTHPRKSSIERGMVDIEASLNRYDERGVELIRYVARQAGFDRGSTRQDEGVCLAQGGKWQDGIV